MAQRRGWIWLFSGVLLALIAGLLTLRTINEATAQATLSQLEEMPTLQVLVAAQDIAPRQPIDESMVKVQKMPAILVPEGYLRSTTDVVGRMPSTPIVPGEILLAHRLVNPTDPNAPVLYRMHPNDVLVAVPASALLGQVGMLSVGDRIDIAYTVAIDFNPEDEQHGDTPVTTFLSLQNLEVKGLLRRQPPTEETSALLRPDALLLAVSPQDALVLKHLVDTGAPMGFFLRAPGNETLSPVIPVDAQYIVDRFQLQVGPSAQAVEGDRAVEVAAQSTITATLNDILNNATNEPIEESNDGE